VRRHATQVKIVNLKATTQKQVSRISELIPGNLDHPPLLARSFYLTISFLHRQKLFNMNNAVQFASILSGRGLYLRRLEERLGVSIFSVNRAYVDTLILGIRATGVHSALASGFTIIRLPMDSTLSK
jgi:hypothetical protein